LVLYFNNIVSLPESFGSLTVGGNLSLSDNQLESLPESFGSLTEMVTCGCTAIQWRGPSTGTAEPTVL